jgi:hypothetical protein
MVNLSDKYLCEMIDKQRSAILSNMRLSYNDIRRISKYIDNSLFDTHKCSIWTGYITNKNKSHKGQYINFYYNKKKTALHRLLYINFIDNLDEDEYVKFTCDNKGRCCNINHLNKFKYQRKIIKESQMEEDNPVSPLHEKTHSDSSDFFSISLE